MIALACAGGSACSHRRRDTGRDTPYYLLDLCRPSDGRRARRDWRRRGAQLQRRLPPCVYDERRRLPVGLAVGAADQGPRACHSARGLTGRERDLTFRGPGTEGSNPAPSSGESANPRSTRLIGAAARLSAWLQTHYALWQPNSWRLGPALWTWCGFSRARPHRQHRGGGSGDW